MSKVFVLGAGASREYRSVKGLSVPVDSDFWGTTDCIIAKAINNKISGPQMEDGGHLNFKKIINNLKAWYKIKRLRDLNQYGLEKIFSDVENEHQGSLDDFKRLLEWVLFYIIRSIDGNSAEKHYAFASSILRPGDSIITFNYDVIIDQAVWDVSQQTGSRIQWHPSSGYGLSFNGYTNKLMQGFLNGIPTDNYRKVIALEYAPSDVLIFKLHGSLGWVINDDALTLYLADKSNKKRLAYKGHLAGNFFIVPPLQNKQFPKWMEKLWQDAEDRLICADQIFCIGYSFPRTDSKAINMFKRTCKDKSIHIILPEIAENEKVRFCGIFGNEPAFIPKTFFQWIRKTTTDGEDI